MEGAWQPIPESSLKGRLVVLGAGNWGTTLANIHAPFRETVLWTRTPEQAEELSSAHINSKYLPDVSLSSDLRIKYEQEDQLSSDDLLLIAVPSHQVRNAVISLKKRFPVKNLTVTASKGFEHLTMKTMSQVLKELLPNADIVVLSGPNIAREIAIGKPARAVLASKRLSALRLAARFLKNDTLIYETSRDVHGIELCASLKGILAIAVGLSDGLNLGDNFTGLIMTYGLHEFATIAKFMDINENTLYGIAGLGDIVTSSLSPSGRNRRFGRLLAQGKSTGEALESVGMVVEGVEMLKTIDELEDMRISVPLFSTIKRIVFGQHGKSVSETLLETVINYSNSGK